MKSKRKITAFCMSTISCITFVQNTMNISEENRNSDTKTLVYLFVKILCIKHHLCLFQKTMCYTYM